MIARALAPYVLAALVASHAGSVWYGWNWRGDVERARVDAAQSALRVAQSRIIGLAEAQALVAADRDRLRQELDDAAIADPDADNMCLGADSVRRLGAQ